MDIYGDIAQEVSIFDNEYYMPNEIITVTIPRISEVDIRPELLENEDVILDSWGYGSIYGGEIGGLSFSFDF